MASGVMASGVSGVVWDRDSGAESICSPDNQPILVRALHAFRGANNDELCFAKDDVIVVRLG